jgi:hygromycin-B 4-O-kinase
MAADRRGDVLDVRALLPPHFGDVVGDVYPLAGGFFSRAYAFTAAGRSYVIRLNTAAHAAEGFAKDDYAFRRFASPALPIPRIIIRGSTADTEYAISEQLPGRTLTDCTPEERRAFLPAVFDTLEAVAKADVSASHGYGYWSVDGNGSSESWHDFLAAAIEDESVGYYAGWHRLFRDSFLERDVYETIYRGMLQLMPFCPDERALIHNDYQFENILVEGACITGVIDWANALYGDPLYDVARLVAWSARTGWWYDDGADLLRTRFGGAPHYRERIACYQCHIGLDDMRFYAMNRKRADYDFLRDRLLALVVALPRA